MPYATDGRISQDPIEGGIEITEKQYAMALAGIVDGKVVSIEKGTLVVADQPAPPEPKTPEPTPEMIEQRARFELFDADVDVVALVDRLRNAKPVVIKAYFTGLTQAQKNAVTLQVLLWIARQI